MLIFIAFTTLKINMAHTKSAGSTKLGRESASQRLGIKRQNNQKVLAGEILIRQRGTKYIPGANIKRAGDDTLYAAKDGTVSFRQIKKTRFDGRTRYATEISLK
jgi:large subunit ribosomal protein L27